MVADAYREINSIIWYNIDQDILKKKFQDTYMTLSHADKKILNQWNDHMKQLIEKDDIDEAFSLRLIFQLAALGWTFLAWMARENYRTGNSKVEEISPMQKEKIMLMSKIVTAEQIFSQTQRWTFDYRKVDQESIDTSTYTGEFISRLASFWLTLDDFFAIKKDIFNVYAKGVLQASFDQEKIDIYTEWHNYAEVTLPPVDIKSYILSVDMKVLQESILSRFLPTVLRPEARDEIVWKIVWRIRQEALNDTDGSITRLVSAAENQATFYFTNILQVATNSDSLVVDFNFNNETEHVLTGEHYHEEVLDWPNDIQGGTIDLRKDQ